MFNILNFRIPKDQINRWRHQKGNAYKEKTWNGRSESGLEILL